MQVFSNSFRRIKDYFAGVKNRVVGYVSSLFGGYSGGLRVRSGSAYPIGMNTGGTTALEKLSNETRGKANEVREELFSLKTPQNLNDYYYLGRFMVSKRLGNIVLALLVVFSLWFIWASFLPGLKLKKVAAKFGLNTEAKSYFYDAHKLKNFSGPVRVFSKKSGAAYDGGLTNGVANGPGVLYDKDGSLLYRGDFKNNKFSGKGTIYHKNGIIKYTGEFLENLYSGSGELYSENGQPVYMGSFVEGLKNGKGTLYNASAAEVYAGVFFNDLPHLNSYLGADLAEIAKTFLGPQVVYNSDNRVMLSYLDVDCVLAASRSQDSVQELGEIEKIFVMAPSYYPGTSKQGNRLDLANSLPGNFLNGFVNAGPEEMCVIDVMRQSGKQDFKSYEAVSKEKVLDGVYNLTQASFKDEFYISKYKINGFVYTFYFEKLDEPYVFYSIERLG